jgi:hypothetical protein
MSNARGLGNPLSDELFAELSLGEQSIVRCTEDTKIVERFAAATRPSPAPCSVPIN